jgi:hypothetical protein
MNAQLFFVSLLIAIAGPIVAIAYLRPILFKVMRMLCDAEGSAEFWIRCAYLLAVTGTLLLMLMFGEFRENGNLVDTVRRSLALVLTGVFVTVALISRNVWTQVREWIKARDHLARLQAVDQQASAGAQAR